MRLPRHTWLLLTAFLLPLPFLFLTQLSPEGTLWLDHLWDTGHVILFVLWMIIAVRWLPLPLTAFFVATRALVLFAAAVSIEYIQLHTGRDFSYMDMYLDACGIAIGMRLSVPALGLLPTFPRYCVNLLIVALAAVGLREPFLYALDRFYMEVQFPQLWSAAQPFPTLRFDDRRHYSIVDDTGISNLPGLQKNFNTKEYSTLEWLEIKPDWRGYSVLNIDVTNPAPTPFDIVCRIHDEGHWARGGELNDRFNRTFTLQPGLNRLAVNLADVESAPANRKMQMDKIVNLACFTMQLRNPRMAYFHDIWLGQ